MPLDSPAPDDAAAVTVHSATPRAIGWREYIELPEWGVSSILAKSDTGALGSAIDVDNIEILEGNRVRFDLMLSRKKAGGHPRVEATIIRKARIRSSNGARQTRVTVGTLMRIGGIERQVEFSLVSRQNMLCRVLLGRKALDSVFLVDSGRKFLLSAPPHTKPKPPKPPRKKKKKRREI